MAMVSDNLVKASRAASERMADRVTPFVFEEWYVAAFSEEVSSDLLARKILGKPIVLFRSTSGAVVALDDRCIHRSFPLSRGHKDGDSIVCGYHGFQYDTSGRCIRVPSVKKCPAGLGVRAYPVREDGPFVWIWMGLTDPTEPKALRSWHGNGQWTCSHGYFRLEASYIRLHENLLDLTHLGFLHAATIGSADYASAPYEVTLGDGYFSLVRSVVPTTLPPVWASTTGLGEIPTAARIATSEFLSPAAHEVNVTYFDSAVGESLRPEFKIRTAHMITPESNTSTHYFLLHGRDFGHTDAAITRAMHDGLFAAFEEDVVGLKAQDEMLEIAGSSLFEVSVPADKPGIAMREYIKRRALAEHPS